jgi:hypothetical protein
VLRENRVRLMNAEKSDQRRRSLPDLDDDDVIWKTSAMVTLNLSIADQITTP